MEETVDADYGDLELKPNHSQLPLWVLPNFRIFVETFAAKYDDTVQKFVVNIAKPISRSSYIQKYQITQFTLYAAMALEKNKTFILSQLSKYNKFK